MKSIKSILGIVTIAAVFSSCSTDFDVIAPYEETTVVYGLLDKNDTTHFIKINKSFLGPGNAYEYASVQDSSEYASLTGVVEKVKNGNVVATYTLSDTLITSREPGAFHYPENKMYYFTSPGLDSSAEYRLRVLVNEGQKEVTASTDLVQSVAWGTPSIASPLLILNFAYNNSNVSGVYPNQYIRFLPNTSGKKYDTWLRFNYEEVTTSGSELKTIEWQVDNYTPVLGDAATREIVYNGSLFYNAIKARVSAPGPDVLKRVFRGVDVIMYVAGKELFTYMQVNEPSTGVVQERPNYTNISNGIGIFSSRMTNRVLGKEMNFNSVKELCIGGITGSLGFCSDNPAHSAEAWYCP